MAKSDEATRNGTPATPTNGKPGFQPLNEGYVPLQKGYVPKPQASTATQLPLPPKGGTGVTSTVGQVPAAKE